MTRADRSALPAFVATHCGKSLLWTAGDAFALYTMIVVLKLPAAVAGALFLAGSIWNAGLDALWGLALARSPTLRRLVGPIGSVAAMVACASFVALPLAPHGAPITAGLLLALFRTAFALFDVPHNAVTTRFAQLHGHLRIMRLRTLASAGAGLVVALAAIPLLMAGSSALSPAALATLGLVAGVLLLPLPGLLAKAAEVLPTPSEGPRPRIAAPVLVFCMIHMIGVGALAAVGKAILHLDRAGAAILLGVPLILAVARLGAIPIWSAVARSVGISTALAIGYGMCALVMLALPAAMTQGTLAIALVFALFGAGIGGVVLLIWSAFSQLLGQTAGTQRLGSGALHYGLLTATTKIGLGASGYLAALWLGSMSNGPDLSVSALVSLTLFVAPIAMLCGIGEKLRASNAARGPDPHSAPLSACARSSRDCPSTT